MILLVDSGSTKCDWIAVDKDFPPELASVKDAVDHIDHIGSAFIDLEQFVHWDFVGIQNACST